MYEGFSQASLEYLKRYNLMPKSKLPQSSRPLQSADHPGAHYAWQSRKPTSLRQVTTHQPDPNILDREKINRLEPLVD